jgi:hypothetical protein
MQQFGAQGTGKSHVGVLITGCAVIKMMRAVEDHRLPDVSLS